MSYNRIGTPRAYIDKINFDLTNGYRSVSNIAMLQDDGSSAVTFASGQKEDIFDLRPANYATIEEENQAFYIQYDSGISTDAYPESNYLAILGHNFNTADVVFKVELDDASDMASPTIVTTTGNHTKVVNAEADADANYIDPARNGWTLITWSTQTSDNRYVRITFSDDAGTGSNFDDDVKIGAIMWGEYIDFPNAPDLSVQTTIDYDGTKLQDSAGGGTFANSIYTGQPMWAATPPWLPYSSDVPTYTFQRRDGRLHHKMNFSYMADTDLFAQDMGTAAASYWYDSDSLHSTFFQKILGQHNPFLFTIDKDATDANYSNGSYGLFRLADSGFNATQVAHQTWSIGLNLRETW